MPHTPATERRPQLVQAAIDLMAREGVEAGSTRAIAAELGVAQATVHYVFGTKLGLYRAVLEQLTGELVERVRSAANVSDDFETCLRRTASALWERLRERPERSLLFRELTAHALRGPELREVLRSHQRELEETASGLLAGTARRTGGELAVEPQVVARFLLAGLDGIERRHLLLTADADNHLQGLIGPADDDGTGSTAGTDLEHLVTATLHLAGRTP